MPDTTMQLSSSAFYIFSIIMVIVQLDGSLSLGVGNVMIIIMMMLIIIFFYHQGCPAAWSECVTSLVSATVGKYLLPLAGLPWAPVIVIDIRPILASIYSHQYCPLSLAEIGRQFVTICDKISIIFIIISNSGQIFTPPRPSLVHCH